jgi:maltooligosyltrehalose synthase
LNVPTGFQLHPGFTFDDAAAVSSYLARLEVSHLYCSPYLQATAGSTHGYDVLDHARLNDALGGPVRHASFSRWLPGPCFSAHELAHTILAGRGADG